MPLIRKWWVHATPVKGHFPPEATVDFLTGDANKVIVGPFTDAIAAALFVERQRPIEKWYMVSIRSTGGNRYGEKKRRSKSKETE